MMIAILQLAVEDIGKAARLEGDGSSEAGHLPLINGVDVRLDGVLALFRQSVHTQDISFRVPRLDGLCNEHR
jgi:hypothetical protein